MVDFLYSVITRPIANEPEPKSHYAVAAPFKDGKAREIDKDDPREKRRQIKKSEINEELSNLPEEQKGKGVYRDKEGRRHLDIYA